MKHSIKFLAIFLCICAIPFQVNAFSVSDIDVKPQEVNTVDIQGCYNEVCIGLNTAFSNEFLYKTDYPEDYGGSYVKDGQYLVVCVTSDSELQRYQAVMSIELVSKIVDTAFAKTDSASRTQARVQLRDYVQYETVAFSYKYLDDICSLFFDKGKDLNIIGFGVKQADNCVEITVASEKDQRDVIQFLQENGIDLSAVDIIVDDNKIENDSIARAGQPISYVSGGYQYIGTIGFQAYDRDTGKYGVVTNDHVSTVGITNTYGTTTKGMVSTFTQNAGLDASFTPFSTAQQSGNPSYEILQTAPLPPPIKTIDDLAVPSAVIEGLPIEKYGYTTGFQTGTISIVHYWNFGDNDKRDMSDRIQLNC